MSVEEGRVAEARRRLRDEDSNPYRDDQAIRLVTLDAPRPDNPALELHRALAIVAGLTEAARQSIAATVDAIRLRNPNVGLTGRVEVGGRRRPIADLDRVRHQPGTTLATTPSLVRSSEVALYHDLVESIERATELSSAELRGADQVAIDLAIRLEERTSELLQSDPANFEQNSPLAIIDSVALPADLVDGLRASLAELDADTSRRELQDKLEEAKSAKHDAPKATDQLSPLLADLMIAEADGCLAAYDAMPGGPADVLNQKLAIIGLFTPPADAPEVARSVVEDNDDLVAMRSRLVESTDPGQLAPAPAPPPDDPTPLSNSIAEQLRELDSHRLHIQRRLRAQQQLLAIARYTMREISGLEGSTDRDDHALTPILIEDPLDDIPARYSGIVLSMLLRYSANRQVVCISDLVGLSEWSQSVGERAAWVDAPGWFGGHSERSDS